MWYLVCLGGLGLLGWLVFRRRAQLLAPDDRRLSPPPPEEQIRIMTDGFLLNDPSIPARARVEYRYVAQEQEHQGYLFWLGSRSGQFVYTGVPPSMVEILAIVHPQDMQEDESAAGWSDQPEEGTDTTGWVDLTPTAM